MTLNKVLEDRVSSIGGGLKVSDRLGNVVTFYHKDFSKDDLEVLADIEGINVLAFYMCNIKGEDVKKIVQMSSIERLGFYSCPNVNDIALSFLIDLPRLKYLTFVDAPVTKKTIDDFKSLSPLVKVKEPDYSKIDY